jgi:hypothetical protein
VALFGPISETGIAFTLPILCCSLLLIGLESLRVAARPLPHLPIFVSVYGLAGVACSVAGFGVAWVPVALSGLLLSWLASRRLSDFNVGARLMLVAYPMFVLFAATWCALFLLSVSVSPVTQALLLLILGVTVLTVPAALIGQFGEWEGLGRRVWRRPRLPLEVDAEGPHPMVSLHVPTYAEPPELVIATLDALALLDYPNFEVLVIDNNTKDPGLWQPVQAHCLRLGNRFRFLHIPVLAGAKAGAVNLALAHTSAHAELIGVLDSDYRAEPDFLGRLVGFFADAHVGFVQTPHDYRNWQASLYQRLCYWEYAYGVKNLLAALNEHGAAYTIGTMCLIRRSALEAVGGWAEWCLTEDSELAIRLHAHGYSGIYLTTTFGRGLIPETFLEYKSQRFRWACGPVQQLRHHFRLLVPGWLGGTASSELTITQQVHELSHGLGLLNTGMSVMSTGMSAGLLISMLVNHEVVAIPVTLWAILAGRASIALTMSWLIHRVVLGCSTRDMAGAFIAKSALSYTIASASLAGVLNRPALWRRTNKFPTLPAGLRVLTGVWPELGLGITAVTGAVMAAILAPQVTLLSLVAAGLLYQGMRFLAAPALALLAERDIRRGLRVARLRGTDATAVPLAVGVAVR